MISRPCPICRIGKIWRKEQRTCCDHCSRTWRQMTPGQQAMAVEKSFDVLEDIKPKQNVMLDTGKYIVPGPDDLDDEESLTPPWLK